MSCNKSRRSKSQRNKSRRNVSRSPGSLRRRNRPLGYDVCEPRQLLAGITFNSATSQIIIGGTAAADTATVTQQNNTLTVTQSGFGSRQFNASGVSSIAFIGLGGDDVFRNRTSVSSFAFGGGGNDRLIGGGGVDRLIGNTGNDFIFGGGGDDYLAAGAGNDQLDGAGGNDRLLGISGTNNLSGGTGNDEIYGGIGRDFINAGDGNNIVAGGSGNDQITSGSGVDLIYGGLGDDFVQSGDGNDRLIGQGGNDRLNGGRGVDVIFGNDGNDILTGAFDSDRLIGGRGTDMAVYSGFHRNYRISVSGISAFIVDLRGSTLGGSDAVRLVERYQFADTTRGRFNLTAPQPVTPGQNPVVPTTPQPVTPTPVTPTPPPTPTPVVPTPNPTSGFEVVYVQPVVAANDDGSNQAQFFGNAQQEAEIKQRIDAIYAQASVDIEWLPTRFIRNTFINVGNGSGQRAGSDLGRIISQGDSAGVGSPDRLVIDLYFVERVPAFSRLSDFTANGLAFVGAPGAAVHNGDRLLGTSGGREIVASVTAHEIGHNLGLPHVDDSDNLLFSGQSDDDGDNLNRDQINTIRRSPLSQVV